MVYKASDGENPRNRGKKKGLHHKAAALRFVPFPVDVFPTPVAEFIKQGASALCCDISFIALPLLAAFGAAIGNSRRLRLKKSWDVPPIVWTVVVSPSGTMKSPPFELALRPARDREHRTIDLHNKQKKEHDISLRKAKGKKVQSEFPPCKRLIVDDTTIEALSKLLSENPRGLLCANDELSGWFGGFEKYASAQSSSEPKWLELFNGRSMIVDRKGEGNLAIKHASVCLTGTIQPMILRGRLSESRVASGLAARLLFAMPPSTTKQWTEDEICEQSQATLVSVFDALYELQMSGVGDGASPKLVYPTEEAKIAFVKFYNEHNLEQSQLDDNLYAAFAKLEEYAARFALIFHCIECAISGEPNQDHVSSQSMKAGIELCGWFKNEATRVYAAFSNEASKLDWCREQQRTVTAYDFHREFRRDLKDSTEAEELMQTFVAEGLGEWSNVPPTSRGGRPSRGFRMWEHS